RHEPRHLEYLLGHPGPGHGRRECRGTHLLGMAAELPEPLGPPLHGSGSGRLGLVGLERFRPGCRRYTRRALVSEYLSKLANISERPVASATGGRGKWPPLAPQSPEP